MAHYSEKPYVQQPQAVPGMMVVPGGGGNRNAKNMALSPEGREWSNGLCDCCNEPGTCMLSWCCPCIVYSKNKSRYEHLNTKGVPHPTYGGSACNSDCWIHALITGCCGAGWILQFMQRGNVRQRYNIKGGGCGDCCTAFFCTPCELTQEHQELELEERSFGGHHGA